jgi:integrase
MMTETIIRLKPWEENGRQHIALDFGFNAEIIMLLRKLGAELSPLCGHWLLPATGGMVHAIATNFDHRARILNCGVLPFNQKKATENRSQPKALSFEQVCQMLKVCRSIKQRCLLTLMYSSGLRASEVARIRLNDLNFHRSSISIHAQRGWNSREAVLAETSMPILNSYLQSYQPKEWLFEGAVNGHQSILGTKIILKQALVRAGIYIESHGLLLRNSLACHLLLQKVEPELIENILYGPLHLTKSFSKLDSTG